MRFKDGGVERPALRIFRSHGYGWIRLRLFHTPANNPEGLARPLPNDLPYTLDLARRAKALGYKFLLDFHYSDTWADPGKQFIPKSWEGRTHAEMQDSVFQYTRSTLLAFKQADAFPDMVQIGNEITSGLLWPGGKTPNWKNLGDLLKAGIRGVDSATGASVRPLIMLHLDRGGDPAGTRYWFDHIHAQGVAYDIIGQSYYPQWHGTLADLGRNFTFMGNTYGKDIILVEVAYTALADGTSPFPLTDAGQALFLDSVDQVVRATPNNRGKGVMWWEPTAGNGTRSLFDSGRNAKPAIKVFDYSVGIRILPRSRPSRMPDNPPYFRPDGRRSGRTGISPAFKSFPAPPSFRSRSPE